MVVENWGNGWTGSTCQAQLTSLAEIASAKSAKVETGSKVT